MSGAKSTQEKEAKAGTEETSIAGTAVAPGMPESQVHNSVQVHEPSTVHAPTVDVSKEAVPEEEQVLGELNATKLLQRTKYEKPNLEEFVADDKQHGHLTAEQRKKLLQTLKKNERVFQGCRGNYTGGAASLKLKPGAKPHWAKPYPIPLKNKDVTEQELYRQVEIGALIGMRLWSDISDHFQRASRKTTYLREFLTSDRVQDTKL